MARYAIFLGAGASAAEGAPIQAGLVRACFHAATATAVGEWSHHAGDVFSTLFGLEDLTSVKEYPTFEEVLRLIDIAIMLNAALPGLPTQSRESFGLDLRTA